MCSQAKLDVFYNMLSPKGSGFGALSGRIDAIELHQIAFRSCVGITATASTVHDIEAGSPQDWNPYVFPVPGYISIPLHSTPAQHNKPNDSLFYPCGAL
jgi:hypothetical protein